MPKFFLITVGEDKPDFFSSKIQRGLSLRYGRIVNKSHALILVEDAGPWSGIWESVADGFHGPKPAENYFVGHHIVDKVELDVPDPWEAIQWLREFCGTPYAHLQFLLFVPTGLKTIAKHVIPKFLLRLIANGKMLSFCSESCAHFIRNNCRDAFEDPECSVTACDTVDPVLIAPLAEKYRVKSGN